MKEQHREALTAIGGWLVRLVLIGVIMAAAMLLICGEGCMATFCD